jgi:sugar lactone lactonase YvrE
MADVTSGTRRAEMIVDARCELGEAPLWDHRQDVVVWVDILSGELHSWAPATQYHEVLYRADQPIGTVSLHDDGYVLAIGTSFVVWSSDGSVRPLATVTGELPGHRFNDGAVDPEGRFLAGTVGPTEDTPTGRLHRLEHDGKTTVLLDGLTLSNGIDFTADGRTMYLIDSPTRSVQVFDYGDEVTRRGSLADTDGDELPDGMCVDAEEHLWVAYFEGHRLVRYTPDGDIDLVVQLPVSQVTSCCFGDPTLDTLYISTARENFSPQRRRAEPTAGSVFRARTGHRGRRAPICSTASKADQPPTDRPIEACPPARTSTQTADQ